MPPPPDNSCFELSLAALVLGIWPFVLSCNLLGKLILQVRSAHMNGGGAGAWRISKDFVGRVVVEP